MTACVKCGGKEFKEVRRTERRAVAGRKFEGTLAGRECTSCGEVFFPMPLLLAFERAIAQELVQTGPANGAAFQFVRKAAEIPAKELAALLDVTPTTVSRWENDKIPVDVGAWITLGALLLDTMKGATSTRDRLLAARHPKKVRNVVRVQPRPRAA